MRRPIRAVDLFCGAGGTSSGLRQACEKRGLRLQLLAINHWDVAIATHEANHPDMQHLCADIDNINPRSVVPSGKLDLLVASPECQHHSRARGGRPINDQKRASAWHILRWAEALQIRGILIENVPEFQDWAPIGSNGRPLKSKKGETFRAFVAALESLGYRVEFRVLNAADYGGATTRERLFILARKGTRRIHWPEPTHSRSGNPELFGPRKPWRPAREIIDWNIPGKSIFTRKRPLAKATLQRIEAGLRKFGGENAEPFLVILRGTAKRQINGSARSLDEPVPTISAGGVHAGICEPFVLSSASGGAPRHVDEPVPTITSTSRGMALVQPFLVPFYGERDGQEGRTHSVDQPVPTLPAANKFGLVEPFLLTTTHGGRERSLDDPMPTITCAHRGEHALIEPYVVHYYGNGDAKSVSEPLGTVTTKDRFGLVQPMGLDIRFRMLQPHELAGAMGFEGYEFTGTKTDQVKQIGNAVSVEMARALCSSLLPEGKAA